MRRRPKPAKAKSEPKLPGVRKSPKNAGSRVRDLEKRLAEAVDQQTATSEILQVISSSPTDVEPVFDAIVKSAAKLCGASRGGILRFDGEMITIAGAYNASPEGFSPEDLEAAGRFYPRPAGRDTAIGRAILERRAVQIPDVALDAEYGYSPAKYRTILAVPMLRSGVPIGGITMWRREVRPFSENRSHCSRPSLIKQSLPSKMRVCSVTSPRRWSSRPPPATSCASSAARRRMCSRCSTRSPPTLSVCVAPCGARSFDSMAS